MPAKSLLEIATTACIKNIRELDSVGDYLLYKTIRPLLLKIDNPKQLRTIEINSPQIQGETGEIWLKIIKHEFPMEFKQKAYKPPNATKWYRVYEKYKSDHQKALDESEAKLKSAFMGIKKDREKTITKIVDDRRLLPQGGRVGPKKPWGFGSRDPNGSTLAFTRGSRTKTNNGASVMRKVRRETKEIASIHGSLSRPTQSSNAISKIRKAPPAMVNDYQRASQPAIRPPPPKPTPSEVVEAHEERAQYITDSDSDGGGGDDLFDDDPSPPRQTLARPSSSTLKGPSPSPSKPAAKAKRGLLSNSYRGPKPQAAAAPSQPRSSRPVKEERRSPIPEREVLSPSPEAGPSSSPPPAVRLPPAVNPRKRKGTDIFMKPKRRA